MLTKLLRKTAYHLVRFKLSHKKKIFCIGMNKTGTTSLEKAFTDLGYILGNQNKAEWLLHDYNHHNFAPIIDYCRTAQVFQDFPFSYPDTFRYLDRAYPGSKFILSVRNSAEDWYNSFTRYYAAIFGNGKIPTVDELKNNTYVYKGWLLEAMNILFKTPGDDLYNKKILTKKYTDHNNEVMHYFANRPDDLLVINLAEKDSYEKFCKFLKIDSPFDKFPWLNKTGGNST